MADMNAMLAEIARTAVERKAAKQRYEELNVQLRAAYNAYSKAHNAHAEACYAVSSIVGEQITQAAAEFQPVCDRHGAPDVEEDMCPW